MGKLLKKIEVWEEIRCPKCDGTIEETYQKATSYADRYYAEEFGAEETCPMCKKDNPIIGGEVCAECTQYLEDEQDRFSQRYGAEGFEATKGMDTYAQPFSELKIKPTKTKVGILLATVVAGGLWYSNKMKEE